MGAEVEEQKTVNKEGLWSCSFFSAAYFHGVVYLDESVILNLEFVEL